MKLSLYPFNLQLKHVFRISRDSQSEQATLVIELNDGRHNGFGEAPTDPFYEITIENLTNSLESIRTLLEPVRQIEPEIIWQQASELMPDNLFALSALDQAAYDLWGKQKGLPVYQLWGLDNADNVPSSFTIGIDEISQMVERIVEVPDWPIYKIKLGTENDIEIVRELREHTKSLFRVDANCGWNAEQTVHNSRILRTLGVEFIEQPLDPEDWDGAKYVFENAMLPIIADESCVSEDDIERCHKYFHGVNIKLCKCGGITPARRMIKAARELCMKTMIGCMVESSVGISAIAQLLPMLDYVDMDGAELLREDVATGVILEKGHCLYPEENGTGAQLLQHCSIS
ncbi:dipeptide epimerase [Bythopirellula goksoeyrii]|uniref:Dipeptide epimerase n=1 Tax=Bythopirellula goksoeyrii TaxID=1400387 RepID=A0A5B9QFG1_9BACT|nr:dipeptide epimerase [Bythopirellula goksoeyrii]QEG36292.1 L-Ala-D/L-Glu epimerase [Bythopirellula goksoeyrii]